MKWGFLFQLFLMLVELCDPTTPFIRVGHRVAAPTRAAVIATAEAKIPGAAIVQEDGAKKPSVADALEAQFHFSLVAVSFSMPERGFPSLAVTRDTGLPESQFIDVLKRPPISKAAVA